MNDKIIKCLNKLQHLKEHNENTKVSFKQSNNISRIVSALQTDYGIDATALKYTIVDPLSQCIDAHHRKLQDEVHLAIKQHIRDTHLTITNDPALSCLGNNVEHTMEDTIMNAVTYWQHTLTTTHNINNPSTPAEPCIVKENSKTNKNSNNNANTSTKPTTKQSTATVTIHDKMLTGTLIDHNTSRGNRKSLKDRNKKKLIVDSLHVSEHCTNPNCYQCAKENIVNLSDTQLSKTQILLLSKGLSFVPTAPNAKNTEIMKDFNIFAHKTKRKYKQMINPPRARRLTDEPELYRKSTVNNTNDNQSHLLGPKALEDAILAMKNEITNIEQHPTSKHNLTRKERQALKELVDNHTLIINKADKGSTIVVRNRTDYIKEGLEHLSDPNTYIQLERDYTRDVNQIIRNTLHNLKIKGLLSPNMADFCMPPPQVRTACIYFLKKIHKSPMGIRPIVSTINSPTANVAEFLDIYLQPIMKQLPAYLKDTSHFISEIADIKVTKETWLVTVDVKSLYTNIPNDEGIRACHEAWRDRETTDPQHPPAEVLRHLLEIVLKLNTFEFDNKHYLQKFGTAMGSKLAPAYANTFMGKLEKSILDSAPKEPRYYRRFIDDIFMIWQHSEEELTEFLTRMNKTNKSIQFTHEKSQQEIVFLDVVVYKKATEHQTPDTLTLNVKTHIKPTNKQLYVREDSYHPPGTGKGIAIGEATRYLRTNSEQGQFQKMMLKHKRNLTKRGYPNSKTTERLKKIKFSSRANRTNKKHTVKQLTTDQQTGPQKPTFVTRYCPNARKAFRIVYKHWTRIDTNIPTLKKFLRVTPRLAYRANANLTRRLVRAKLRRPPTSENPTSTECQNSNSTYEDNHSNTPITELADLRFPANKTNSNITLCHDKNCPLHGKLIQSKTVRSRVSRRTYHTHGTANCDTPAVVYMIQCKQCGRQYVGQTSQSLRMRFSRHLRAIKNQHQPGVLQEHFRKNKCAGTHNISIQILHTITPKEGDTPRDTENALKQLESLWMQRLKSEYPQGLNWAKYDPMNRSNRQTTSAP